MLILWVWVVYEGENGFVFFFLSEFVLIIVEVLGNLYVYLWIVGFWCRVFVCEGWSCISGVLW